MLFKQATMKKNQRKPHPPIHGRAGDSLLNAVRQILPEAAVGECPWADAISSLAPQAA
jgi:hypothetical protein